MARFFSLMDGDIDELVFQVCRIYAVKRCLDTLRFETGAIEEDALDRIIWHGHRTAALYHTGLARRYKSLRLIVRWLRRKKVCLKQ